MQLDRRTFMATGAVLGAARFAEAAGAANSPEPSGRAPMSNQVYVMPAPIEKVWAAFTRSDERKIWFGFPMDTLKGALEVRAPHFFRTVIDHPGLPGPLENTVTFEAMADGGTRITNVQTGFGEGAEWLNALQTSSLGIDEMMQDLALYLRTGVGFPRHTVFHCFDLLKGTREVPGGLEVFETVNGTLAAELGLQPGDTVVSLGGAGIFGFREIHNAVRTHMPGDVVEVSWIRGGQVFTGKGMMTRTVTFRNVTGPLKEVKLPPR